MSNKNRLVLADNGQQCVIKITGTTKIENKKYSTTRFEHWYDKSKLLMGIPLEETEEGLCIYRKGMTSCTLKYLLRYFTPQEINTTDFDKTL